MKREAGLTPRVGAVAVLDFHVDQEAGEENQHNNRTHQIDPAVSCDLHTLSLLKQRNYSGGDYKNQCENNSEPQIAGHKRFLGNAPENKPGKAQLAAVKEEVGKFIREVLFHAPEFIMAGRACQ